MTSFYAYKLIGIASFTSIVAIAVVPEVTEIPREIPLAVCCFPWLVMIAASIGFWCVLVPLWLFFKHMVKPDSIPEDNTNEE